MEVYYFIWIKFRVDELRGLLFTETPESIFGYGLALIEETLRFLWDTKVYGTNRPGYLARTGGNWGGLN